MRIACVIACACLVAGLCLADTPHYLPPGTDQVGGINDLVLIYHGMQKRPEWNAANLLPYVAHVDTEGKPTDWLFDGFLFIEYSTDDAKWLHHQREGHEPPTIEDWQWLADAWFRPSTGLIGLEQAVAQAGEALGEPGHRVKVVISLPIPVASAHEFGPLPDGRILDFREEPDRQAALAWYMTQVTSRWDAEALPHLELVGFYWTAETIPAEEEPLVRWTAAHLHGRSLRLYWIPFFGARGGQNWRELGIDAVMRQPNYFFTEHPDPQRLLAAAKRALTHHTGIEIEFDGRAVGDPDFGKRFWGYLDAGVKYGWMNGALLGYYEGGGGILHLLKGSETGRRMYDALYRFVKGVYEPSGEVDLSALALVQHDNSDNLALASKGAKVHGCIRNSDQPDLAPEKVIDGDIYFYGGMHGFGYFAIPGSLTIELLEPATVARTQTMLWDLDGRKFRYRIDTSLDNEVWEPAVDKSEGGWTGWQVDQFEPRRARFIRLSGLHNSVNPLFQVVEFEVYADPEPAETP